MRARTLVVWVAGLALMALTVRLGFWQLDRAAQKQAIQHERAVRAGAAPLKPSELPRSAVQARATEHRLATITGRWLAEHTVYLDNRPMAGRTGFYVLTPLGLPDGNVLLVQRGWWPRDVRDRARVDAPPPPPGEVVVRGRVALAPSRLYELGPETTGSIRQNLDIDAFARERRLPLMPWLLVQLEDTAATGADGLARQWPEPAADVHKHHGYAAQWFALATLTALLLAWFQVLRPWRRRRTS